METGFMRCTSWERWWQTVGITSNIAFCREHNPSRPRGNRRATDVWDPELASIQRSGSRHQHPTRFVANGAAL